MAFGSVAEAADELGHVPAWLAYDAAEQQRRLDVAELWIRTTYVVPIEPSAEELAALVQAEQVAARTGILTPLFPAPGTSERGAITREKKRVGSLEKETVWSEPAAAPSGKVIIGEVDAILGLVGIERRGASLGSAVFVV